ncbi:MAG TPA: hypothetical protein ENN32_02525 [Chloroflexi bacterium]|nr:hypothetical protein [Chloroflexota bacterium]
MIIWFVSAFLAAVCCVLLHTMSVRMMNPAVPAKSLSRFWQFFWMRFAVLGVYLWQLVQQNLLIIASSMAIFIVSYWIALILIVRYKQDWMQLKETKDQTLWIP